MRRQLNKLHKPLSSVVNTWRAEGLRSAAEVVQRGVIRRVKSRINERAKEPQANQTSPDSVSVVIASHNRAAMLAELVAAVKSQASVCKAKVEIIAVSNGSSDRTYETMVEAFGLVEAPELMPKGSRLSGDRLALTKDGNVTVIIYDLVEGGLSKARNRGMHIGTGEVVAFLDDDVRIRSRWLKSLIEGFSDNRVGVLGGKIELWFDGIEEPEALSRHQKRLLGWNDWGERFHEVDPHKVFGGNFALHRRVIATVGEFNTDFGRVGDMRLAGEETEFFLRTQKLSHRFFYSPKFAVEHLVNETRLSPKYIYQSARGVGASRVRLPDRRVRMTSENIFTRLSQLHELRVKSYDLETEAAIQENRTQREDCLGELTSILDDLYGSDSQASLERLNVDLSQAADDYFNIDKRLAQKEKFLIGFSQPFIDLSSQYKVTVVIVTHNDDLYLRTTLDSVLNQTHRNIEVIVVDSLSTDGSVEIVKSYQQEDQRLHLVQLDENVGPSRARNIGISRAKGEYVTFLDGDDFMALDAILVRLAAARLAPFAEVAGSYCGSRPVNDVDTMKIKAVRSGVAPQVIDFLSVEGNCPFPVHSPILKTSIAKKFGGFNTSINQAEDWEFWQRILRHGYVFVPSGFTAVAYRQKVKRSLIRSAPQTHTENAAELFLSAHEEMDERSIIKDTPFVFKEPVSYYKRHLLFAERFIRHNVMNAIGNDEGVAQVIDGLPSDIIPLVKQRADIANFIAQASQRMHSHYGDFKTLADFFGQRFINSMLWEMSPVVGPSETLKKVYTRERVSNLLAALEPLESIVVYEEEELVTIPNLTKPSNQWMSGLQLTNFDEQTGIVTFSEGSELVQHYMKVDLPPNKLQAAVKVRLQMESSTISVFRLHVRLSGKNYQILVNTSDGSFTSNASDAFEVVVNRTGGMHELSCVLFLDDTQGSDTSGFILFGPGDYANSEPVYRGQNRSFKLKIDHLSVSMKSPQSK